MRWTRRPRTYLDLAERQRPLATLLLLVCTCWEEYSIQGQATNGKDIMGSFDFYQWPHDPNLSASVFLKMIEMWSRSHNLPPVLYLQLDNCVKENKNQFMIFLLAYLVEMKILEKVFFVMFCYLDNTGCFSFRYLLIRYLLINEMQLLQRAGLEVTAGQRSMSGQNYNLTGQMTS